MSQDNPIIAYKGFDQKLQCRGFQYQVGGEYQHEGTVEACRSGYHSCEFPLDVFGYYAPATSRFAVVRASGQLSRDGSDSKIASANLTIEAEIGIPTLVAKAVEWVMARPDKSQEQTLVAGNRSAAMNTGDYSAASVEGKASVAAVYGGGGRVKAAEGGALVLVHRNDDDGEIVHIRAAKVGQDGIKADTWYQLDAAGEFVEVQPC